MTLPLIFTEPWVPRLGWTLVHFVWQGALLAALFALFRGMPRSAPGRYGLACLALAALTAAPVATFLLTAGGPTVPSAVHRAATVPPAVGAGLGSWPLTPSNLWQRTLPWLVLIWFAGVAAFSVRLTGGWLAARRLRTRQGRPAPPEWQATLDRLMGRIGVSRPVRLTVSSLVDAPAVIGWLRPVILAPVGALTGLPREQVEALLAHELAHIRRHDYLVNTLQSVVETVLFYHPAVWWISGQIRAEREACCDDLAVAASGDVLVYARALAQLEALRPAHAGVVLTANGGSLRQRIRRLIAPVPARSPGLTGSLAAGALSLLLLAGIGAMALRGAPQDAPPRDQPVVSRESMWPDTVTVGNMVRAVRALGTLGEDSKAQLNVAERLVHDVATGLPVSLDWRGSSGQLIPGSVVRIGPRGANGTVIVEARVEGPIPAALHPPVEVDGIIEIERLTNVVKVGRPVFAEPNTEGTLFRIEPGGDSAVRVKVQFGRNSINQIEIRGGLQPGDRVILSDMSAYKGVDRIAIR